MTLMALKAAADINQAAENVNLGVKAITDMKKSAKATMDVKSLKIKNAPNQADNFAIFQWSSLLKITFSVNSPAVSDLQAINIIK